MPKVELSEVTITDFQKEISLLTIEKRRLMVKLNAEEKEVQTLKDENVDLKYKLAITLRRKSPKKHKTKKGG